MCFAGFPGLKTLYVYVFSGLPVFETLNFKVFGELLGFKTSLFSWISKVPRAQILELLCVVRVLRVPNHVQHVFYCWVPRASAEGAPKVLPGARNGREVMSFLLGLGRGIREVVPVPHDWMNGYLDR